MKTIITTIALIVGMTAVAQKGMEDYKPAKEYEVDKGYHADKDSYFMFSTNKLEIYEEAVRILIANNVDPSDLTMEGDGFLYRFDETYELSVNYDQDFPGEPLSYSLSVSPHFNFYREPGAYLVDLSEIRPLKK